MPAKKTAAKKAGAKTTRTTRKKRGPAEPRGPEAAASALALDDDAIADLVKRIEGAKGAVLSAYRDPYGGTPLVLASLPIGAVEPTPFQRDLSRTHAERLAGAIRDSGAFLDPVIAYASRDGFLSPNGRHRIAAARSLGQRAITVLATCDPSLAKEQPRSKETDHATAFESPAFLTLGCVYEKRDRFSGSSYNSMLRRVDVFQEKPLPAALRQREQWAVRLGDIDDRVTA